MVVPTVTVAAEVVQSGGGGGCERERAMGAAGCLGHGTASGRCRCGNGAACKASSVWGLVRAVFVIFLLGATSLGGRAKHREPVPNRLVHGLVADHTFGKLSLDIGTMYKLAMSSVLYLTQHPTQSSIDHMMRMHVGACKCCRFSRILNPVR